MLLGYARISTEKQDLARQLDALAGAGVLPEHTYVDRKSGATTDREGLQQMLAYARPGDVIVVHTLDRLGRSVRDTLNMLHDLGERGIGLRNLADPIRVDTSDPDDPMAQLSVVVLALFAQMERTYMLERLTHAREVAAGAGKQVGRPRTVTDEQIRYATHLRDNEGMTLAQIAAETGIARTTLYRHLPARPEGAAPA
ncbi:recombinase family protein [Cellulosimicrobium sp. NPDC057127]|uniref:recombinase family protein n=1 Tax=Cellulosimicrobium sp. NPDC057127 TaxID=3346026 RepID=UPI003638ABCB